MSFEATRRSFVRLLALMPLAGKVAADEAIGKLAGAKADGLSLSGMIGKPELSGCEEPQAIGSGVPPGYNSYVAYARHVKTIGLPSWQEQDFRDRAYNVGALDPDIACKRSWSMSVKIVTQRQRNYERLLEQIDRSAKRSVGRKVVESLLGGHAPWY